MEASIYNQTAQEAGTITLPEEVFNVAWNGDTVEQVVSVMQKNARGPVAHTKERSEVSGGGKKPWRQKGTGRSRHGSIRSPLWRGGGITFGPRNTRSYSGKANKKMRIKALNLVLSQKYRDGELLFVESLPQDGRTQGVRQALQSLLTEVSAKKSFDNKSTVCIVVPEWDEMLARGTSNLSNVAIIDAYNLNALDVLSFKHVVIVRPEESVSILAGRAAARGFSLSGANTATA